MSPKDRFPSRSLSRHSRHSSSSSSSTPLLNRISLCLSLSPSLRRRKNPLLLRLPRSLLLRPRSPERPGLNPSRIESPERLDSLEKTDSLVRRENPVNLVNLGSLVKLNNETATLSSRLTELRTSRRK